MANQAISLYLASTLVIMRRFACRTQDWTKSLSGFWLIHANTYALDSAVRRLRLTFILLLMFILLLKLRLPLPASFFPESWTLLYIYTSSLNHPGDPFFKSCDPPEGRDPGFENPWSTEPVWNITAVFMLSWTRCNASVHASPSKEHGAC